MTWRPMESLLVLRGQVDAIAPNRSRASDGLVGDEAHQSTNSDHNPHYVAGVGDEIVTAIDLTHDPAHGFDSYKFAEALRRNRDSRIKYVISNYRIFSSYASGSRPAWTWGTYSGVDPHTNHVHASVLDAVISDTRTPWNLEGFEPMAMSDVEWNTGWIVQGLVSMQDPIIIPANKNTVPPAPGAKLPNLLAQAVNAARAEAKAAKEAAQAVGTPAPAVVDVAALAAAVAREVTGREAVADRARADALETAA